MTARAIGSLEYAQARISARFGDRPDDVAWRRLEHVRDPAALLDVARNSAFRTWVGGIAPTSTPHAIETTLRAQWRGRVAEVAGWMPGAWRAAILWCGLLPDLAVFAHLARGGEPLSWMHDDPYYAGFIDACCGTCPPASHAGPLVAGRRDPDRIGVLWHAEWMRRAPALPEASLLGELGRVLAAHRRAFAEPGLTDGWPLRRTVEARLTLLFRRSMLDPAMAFAYLGLVALDCERLRGEFLRRVAFPLQPLVA